MADTWLDALSRRETERARARADGLDAAAIWLARGLLMALVWAVTVSFVPFADGGEAAAEGNAVRQLGFILLAVAAAPLLLLRWREALRLLARAWPLALVYAVMAASTAWSMFPEVTVRRLLVMLIVFVVALACASVLRTARAFLPPLLAVGAVIVTANLLSAVLVPGLAWSELGLEGLHPSKNVAGMVGQWFAILFAGALLAVRSPAAFWGLAALTGATFGLLVLSQSKTALGLSVLAVVLLMPALVAARRGGRAALVGLAMVVSGVGGALFVMGVLELGGADVSQVLFGDPTFSQRDDIWRAAMLLIGERPLVGYGFGAQWSMLPVYHPLERVFGFWTGDAETLRILNQSHNGYLDLFLHGGVPLAGAALLFVLATGVAVVGRFSAPPRDRWEEAGTLIFATSFLATLASNLLESTLFFPDGVLGHLLTISTLLWFAITLTPDTFCESGKQFSQK